MIQLIEAADRPAFESQLAQMYRERKRVFVDRLGWEVPVVAGEFEIDQFDTDRAVYVLALDPGGAQLGSARLLPSTGPTLLSEVFPHLCERGVPTGDGCSSSRVSPTVCTWRSPRRASRLRHAGGQRKTSPADALLPPLRPRTTARTIATTTATAANGSHFGRPPW